MEIRTSVSHYFSLRRSLIQLHLDLFKVHRRIQYDPQPDPLTDFEILVLILEDRRYFEHNGIDIKSSIREVRRELWPCTVLEVPARSICNLFAQQQTTDERHCAGNCTKCFWLGLYSIGIINLKYYDRIWRVRILVLIFTGLNVLHKRFSTRRHTS